MRLVSGLIPLLLLSALASAGNLNDLTNLDASKGVKAVLEKSADFAVAQLGAPNGFLNNSKVKITLPTALQSAMPLLRMTGQGQKVDDLVVAMNHAAEAAVAQSKPLLVSAVKSMSLSDAKAILTGGDESVTDFFRFKTRDALAKKMLPLVRNITSRNGLSGQYNVIAAQVAQTGLAPALVSGPASTVEGYVTERALAGLYTVIGEEEKTIRNNPAAAGSSILSKVFGALQN